jgi:hypothetical protein
LSDVAILWNGPERRRENRARLSTDVICRFQMRARIWVLDISHSGALLASDTPFPLGTVGHLQAPMGSAVFSPQVQIRRVVESNVEGHRFELGAVFVSMDDASQRSLDAFLRRANS